MGIWHVIYVITLMSQIVEHIKISVHLKKFGKDIIVEYLLYTVYLLQQIKEHPALFCHCVNSQTRFTIRDFGVDVM